MCRITPTVFVAYKAFLRQHWVALALNDEQVSSEVHL
jgi:hypothetical protein